MGKIVINNKVLYINIYYLSKESFKPNKTQKEKNQHFVKNEKVTEHS